MTRTVDLVADLGEGFGAYRMGDDNALLDVLTSANVACGFHAGDPRIMDATVGRLRRAAVSRWGPPQLSRPGRVRPPGDGPDAPTRSAPTCCTSSARCRPSPPRTAPGWNTSRRTAGWATWSPPAPDYAAAVADAALAVARPAPLIVLAQDGELADAARARGLRRRHRRHRRPGLPRRRHPGAAERAGRRAPRRGRDRRTHRPDGARGRDHRGRPASAVPVRCDTILLHGDNPRRHQPCPPDPRRPAGRGRADRAAAPEPDRARGCGGLVDRARAPDVAGQRLRGRRDPGHRPRRRRRAARGGPCTTWPTC